MAKGFKNLIVWQKAYRFALEIYKETRGFPKFEFYALTQQMRKAAVSISANIAEGYERYYRKEYIRFLTIAKGSLGEVETYLMLAKDLKYLNPKAYIELEDSRQEVARLLRGLINSLSQVSNKGRV